jgi:hypothetical protein
MCRTELYSNALFNAVGTPASTTGTGQNKRKAGLTPNSHKKIKTDTKTGAFDAVVHQAHCAEADEPTSKATATKQPSLFAFFSRGATADASDRDIKPPPVKMRKPVPPTTGSLRRSAGTLKAPLPDTMKVYREYSKYITTKS